MGKLERKGSRRVPSVLEGWIILLITCLAPCARASVGWNDCASHFLDGFYPSYLENSIALCRNGSYAISYDPEMWNPSWTAYHINQEQTRAQISGSLSYFKKDPDLTALGIPHPSNSNDAYDSNWNKGHLCPNRIMSYSQSSKEDTYYTSNIAPQWWQFNQQTWETLEQNIFEWIDFNPDPSAELYIITGVGYFNRSSVLRNDTVARVNFYFSAVCDPKANESAAFIGLNSQNGGGLVQFYRTVDEVANKAYCGVKLNSTRGTWPSLNNTFQLFPPRCRTNRVNATFWKFSGYMTSPIPLNCSDSGIQAPTPAPEPVVPMCSLNSTLSISLTGATFTGSSTTTINNCSQYSLTASSVTSRNLIFDIAAMRRNSSSNFVNITIRGTTFNGNSLWFVGTDDGLPPSIPNITANKCSYNSNPLIMITVTECTFIDSHIVFANLTTSARYQIVVSVSSSARSSLLTIPLIRPTLYPDLDTSTTRKFHFNLLLSNISLGASSSLVIERNSFVCSRLASSQYCYPLMLVHQLNVAQGALFAFSRNDLQAFSQYSSGIFANAMFLVSQSGTARISENSLLVLSSGAQAYGILHGGQVALTASATYEISSNSFDLTTQAYRAGTVQTPPLIPPGHDGAFGIRFAGVQSISSSSFLIARCNFSFTIDTTNGISSALWSFNGANWNLLNQALVRISNLRMNCIGSPGTAFGLSFWTNSGILLDGGSAMILEDSNFNFLVGRDAYFFRVLSNSMVVNSGSTFLVQRVNVNITVNGNQAFGLYLESSPLMIASGSRFLITDTNWVLRGSKAYGMQLESFSGLAMSDRSKLSIQRANWQVTGVSGESFGIAFTGNSPLLLTFVSVLEVRNSTWFVSNAGGSQQYSRGMYFYENSSVGLRSKSQFVMEDTRWEISALTNNGYGLYFLTNSSVNADDSSLFLVQSSVWRMQCWSGNCYGFVHWASPVTLTRQSQLLVRRTTWNLNATGNLQAAIYMASVSPLMVSGGSLYQITDCRWDIATLGTNVYGIFGTGNSGVTLADRSMYQFRNNFLQLRSTSLSYGVYYITSSPMIIGGSSSFDFTLTTWNVNATTGKSFGVHFNNDSPLRIENSSTWTLSSSNWTLFSGGGDTNGILFSTNSPLAVNSVASFFMRNCSWVIWSPNSAVSYGLAATGITVGNNSQFVMELSTWVLWSTAPDSSGTAIAFQTPFLSFDTTSRMSLATNLFDIRTRTSCQPVAITSGMFNGFFSARENSMFCPSGITPTIQWPAFTNTTSFGGVSRFYLRCNNPLSMGLASGWIAYQHPDCLTCSALIDCRPNFTVSVSGTPPFCRCFCNTTAQPVSGKDCWSPILVLPPYQELFFDVLTRTVSLSTTRSTSNSDTYSGSATVTHTTSSSSSVSHSLTATASGTSSITRTELSLSTTISIRLPTSPAAETPQPVAEPVPSGVVTPSPPSTVSVTPGPVGFTTSVPSTPNVGTTPAPPGITTLAPSTATPHGLTSAPSTLNPGSTTAPFTHAPMLSASPSIELFGKAVDGAAFNASNFTQSLASELGVSTAVISVSVQSNRTDGSVSIKVTFVGPNASTLAVAATALTSETTKALGLLPPGLTNNTRLYSGVTTVAPSPLPFPRLDFQHSINSSQFTFRMRIFSANLTSNWTEPESVRLLFQVTKPPVSCSLAQVKQNGTRNTTSRKFNCFTWERGNQNTVAVSELLCEAPARLVLKGDRMRRNRQTSRSNPTADGLLDDVSLVVEVRVPRYFPGQINISVIFYADNAPATLNGTIVDVISIHPNRKSGEGPERTSDNVSNAVTLAPMRGSTPDVESRGIFSSTEYSSSGIHFVLWVDLCGFAALIALEGLAFSQRRRKSVDRPSSSSLPAKPITDIFGDEDPFPGEWWSLTSTSSEERVPSTTATPSPTGATASSWRMILRASAASHPWIGPLLPCSLQCLPLHWLGLWQSFLSLITAVAVSRYLMEALAGTSFTVLGGLVGALCVPVIRLIPEIVGFQYALIPLDARPQSGSERSSGSSEEPPSRMTSKNNSPNLHPSAVSGPLSPGCISLRSVSLLRLTPKHHPEQSIPADLELDPSLGSGSDEEDTEESEMSNARAQNLTLSVQSANGPTLSPDEEDIHLPPTAASQERGTILRPHRTLTYLKWKENRTVDDDRVEVAEAAGAGKDTSAQPDLSREWSVISTRWYRLGSMAISMLLVQALTAGISYVVDQNGAWRRKRFGQQSLFWFTVLCGVAWSFFVVEPTAIAISYLYRWMTTEHETDSGPLVHADTHPGERPALLQVRGADSALPRCYSMLFPRHSIDGSTTVE